MKLLPQNWQLWGFTPVCVRTWRFSVSLAANLARHWNQTQNHAVTVNCQKGANKILWEGPHYYTFKFKSLQVSVSLKHHIRVSKHRFAVSFEGCSRVLSARLSYWRSVPGWLPTNQSSNKKRQTELKGGRDAGLKVWEKKKWICYWEL